jgi:hypothetical protein
MYKIAKNLRIITLLSRVRGDKVILEHWATIDRLGSGREPFSFMYIGRLDCGPPSAIHWRKKPQLENA